MGNTPSPADIELVKCTACEFTDECTRAYITKVRDKYNGRWICGLCIEVVKEELLHSEKLITIEEALNRHINFCKKSQSLSRNDEKVEHPIFVICRVLRRNLESNTPKRALRSGSDNASGGGTHLVRSESCFPALSSDMNSRKL